MPKDRITDAELARDLEFYKSKITYDDAIKALMVLSHDTGVDITGIRGPWSLVYDIQCMVAEVLKLNQLRKLIKEVMK